MDSIGIQLAHKMPMVVNGIDLTKREVGEVFVLPSDEAHILNGLGRARRIFPKSAKPRAAPSRPARHLTFSAIAQEQQFLERAGWAP